MDPISTNCFHNKAEVLQIKLDRLFINRQGELNSLTTTNKGSPTNHPYKVKALGSPVPSMLLNALHYDA